VKVLCWKITVRTPCWQYDVNN